MKKQSFKAYRELDRLFKKNEISNEEDTKQDEIKTIYSDQIVHTDENIFEEDYEDEEYLDEEDEMGLEIESLIQHEKVPSFLDRMKSIQKESKEDKKTIPVSVKTQQINDSTEEEKPEFIKKIEEMKKIEKDPIKEEHGTDLKTENEYTYVELLKKYKQSISINNRLMKLVDSYQELIDEKNSLIQEQKEIISEYEKSVKINKIKK